jgi:hypothetical protein
MPAEEASEHRTPQVVEPVMQHVEDRPTAVLQAAEAVEGPQSYAGHAIKRFRPHKLGELPVDQP